jgi:hypothetical protein
MALFVCCSVVSLYHLSSNAAMFYSYPPTKPSAGLPALSQGYSKNQQATRITIMTRSRNHATNAAMPIPSRVGILTCGPTLPTTHFHTQSGVLCDPHLHVARMADRDRQRQRVPDVVVAVSHVEECNRFGVG